MQVVIIGSGNVATILAIRLKLAGHTIVEVFSKTELHAKKLAEAVNANVVTHFQNLTTTANLYIFAVADNAIEILAHQLKVQENSLVVHTAGSVSMQVLKNCSNNYGVLYPIQSIKKEMNNSTPIPFAIDGCNKNVVNSLLSLTQMLGEKALHCNDEQRLQLHVAAVFASNFVNYMYWQSDVLCSNKNIDFNILQPLIEETATRLKNKKPYEVFTGPAVRKDFATINKHLEVLKKNKNQFEVYQFLTNKIVEDIK